LSRDSLVKGTIILTVAALVARFLGVFQRIPLVYLLEDKGMGSYGVAFNLYSNLLVIATAGIPSALSKLISEKTALGRQKEADRIYRAAVLFALGAGAVMTVLLLALAPWYAAGISGDPKAVLATRAIAPALLMFPLIAVMRGYFQGRQRMMPNGVSQIVEQIFRLITAVGLAYALLSVGEEQAIAGASFGGVIGGVAALAVMLYYSRELRKRDRKEAQLSSGSKTSNSGSDPSEHLSYKQIYGKLLRLSVPIVIFSMTVTLIYNIDSSSIHPLLSGMFDYEHRRELIGILTGRAQSLAGLPIILAIALSQSIVPIISSAYSRGDKAELKRQTSKVLQLAILSGLPAVLLVAVAARPIDGFIFGHEKTAYGYSVGPHLISLLTVSAMFQIVMQTSGAVLMGMGEMRALVASVAIGVAVKLAGNFVLSPWLGIYGIIAATGLCFIVMTWFNLSVLRKKVTFTVLGRRWNGLLLAVSIIAVIGLSLEWLTHRYVHPFAAARLNEGVNAVLVGGFTLVLYPLLLLALRVVTKEDLQNFPRPVQKLLNKGRRLMGRTGG
jgi:stage V sporulation protein B